MRLNRIAYPLTAFLIPVGLRLIPEVFSYPYPIGFDTIAYYIPIMLARLAFRASLLDYLGGTILLDLPITVAYVLVGDALFVMKIVPALLLGFLSWSTCLFAGRFLRWGPVKSLALAIFLSSYFVTLRFSWDLHRNVLGLVFVLLTLAFIEDRKARIRYVAVPALAALAVMSHESSVILIGIIAVAHLVHGKAYRDLIEWIPFFPAAMLVMLQLLSRRQLVYQIQEPAQTMNALSSFFYNVGFVLFAFGFLVPIALVGLKLRLKRHLILWAVICLFFGLLPPILIPTGLPYRWTALLIVPLAVLFFQGADVLNSVKRNWLKLIGRAVVAASLISILIISGSYLGLYNVTQNYFGLAPEYNYLMPVSMVVSTIPIRDIPSVIVIARWADVSLPRTSLLILPFQLYGWDIAAVSSKVPPEFRPTGNERNLDDIISAVKPRTGPMLLYARTADINTAQGKAAIVSVAVEAATAGTQEIYVAWWAPNSFYGDYGNLPQNFAVSFTSGNLAVYRLIET